MNERESRAYDKTVKQMFAERKDVADAREEGFKAGFAAGTTDARIFALAVAVTAILIGGIIFLVLNNGAKL